MNEKQMVQIWNKAEKKEEKKNRPRFKMIEIETKQQHYSVRNDTGVIYHNNLRPTGCRWKWKFGAVFDDAA